MNSVQRAIYQTIAYADIFDYPLTIAELTRRLIGVAASTQTIAKDLRIGQGLETQEGYVFLAGRKKIVSLRKKRLIPSQEKWQQVQSVVRWLSLIPMIQLIGVSGGVASDNADEDDDIDLFIITSSRTVWMTRLVTLLLLDCLGLRRKPGEANVKNKLCVNMFIDEDHATLPQEEQDLFGAYEVLQMRPVWQRGNNHQRFLIANSWAKKFLPNWYALAVFDEHSLPSSPSFFSRLSFLEGVCRILQQWYMRSRRTVEIIEPGRIRFHPLDVRGKVMKQFHKHVVIVGLDPTIQRNNVPISDTSGNERK